MCDILPFCMRLDLCALEHQLNAHPHRITLQHTATLCNTLRHTATHCNILQHTDCNTLHAHCNTPHQAATCMRAAGPAKRTYAPHAASNSLSHCNTRTLSLQLTDSCAPQGQTNAHPPASCARRSLTQQPLTLTLQHTHSLTATH